MPKIAVNEDRKPVFGEDDIGRAEDVLTMLSISIAERIQFGTHYPQKDTLEFGIAAANKRHMATARGF